MYRIRLRDPNHTVNDPYTCCILEARFQDRKVKASRLVISSVDKRMLALAIVFLWATVLHYEKEKHNKKCPSLSSCSDPVVVGRWVWSCSSYVICSLIWYEDADQISTRLYRHRHDCVKRLTYGDHSHCLRKWSVGAFRRMVIMTLQSTVVSVIKI